MHPNILIIKSVFTSIGYISKVTTSSDLTKKTTGVVPTKIVKLANKGICKDLVNCISESIKKNECPNDLKHQKLHLCLKGGSTKQRKLYTASGLPKVSKIFERVLFDQLTKFSINFLPPLLSGFIKSCSTQYILVNLIQKWKKILTNLTELLELC